MSPARIETYKEKRIDSYSKVRVGDTKIVHEDGINLGVHAKNKSSEVAFTGEDIVYVVRKGQAPHLAVIEGKIIGKGEVTVYLREEADSVRVRKRGSTKSIRVKHYSEDVLPKRRNSKRLAK